MHYSVQQAIEILSRTPATLSVMLEGIDEDWTSSNEGEGTWSVYDIVGHLVHGEKTDWIPRAEIILSTSVDKRFKPFDRFAQFNEGKEQTLADRLREFKEWRAKSLERLHSFNLTPENLQLTGIHPAFGEVTLSQLLSTWTVHDLNHLAQICRVMARQYKEAVGPWTAYLKILQ